MSKIFISWSGSETASFRIAEKLKDTLPYVFQSNEYFFSNDIQKGSFGVEQIFENLSDLKIGIFCVTKANIEKPWLNFEAGAALIAVMKNGGMAAPLLIDMTKEEFAASSSPLAKMQATVLSDEKDFLKLLCDMGKILQSSFSEQQIEHLFIRIVKDVLYSVDKLSVTNQVDIQAKSFVTDDGLTKDAKKLLKALYMDYAMDRSHGLSRTEAAEFNDIAEICRLSDMSVDDVRELYKELSEYGYLEYQASDMFEMVNSSLTGKGIKYGEDNFDEPTYIILLREIIKKCDSHNAIVSSQSFNNFSPEDFSILKAKGYIDVPKSLSKSFFVRPTDEGIKEIALRDR